LSPEELSLELELAPEVVARALADLSRCELLEPLVERGYSRRQVAVRLAATGAALATGATLISSITAPTPADALSCGHSGQLCTVKSDCCAGLDCTGPSPKTCK
jgi:hypothetical protein